MQRVYCISLLHNINISKAAASFISLASRQDVEGQLPRPTFLNFGLCKNWLKICTLSEHFVQKCNKRVPVQLAEEKRLGLHGILLVIV